MDKGPIVVTGIVVSVSEAACETLDENVRSSLAARGIPPGLMNVLKRAGELCACRYWIVDNSGYALEQRIPMFTKHCVCRNACDMCRSMATNDGKLFPKKSTGQFAHVTCSRWEELSESMRWHAHTVLMRRLLRAPV